MAFIDSLVTTGGDVEARTVDYIGDDDDNDDDDAKTLMIIGVAAATCVSSLM